MVKDSTKGLTFAEAYELRKTQERIDDKKRKDDEIITHIANIEDLHTIMGQVRQSIEANMSFRNTRAILKTIPSGFTKHVKECMDGNMLDVLQLAIIHNKPGLVNYLLEETSYFPVGYHPMYNPYCHLAAFTGNASCLKLILQQRPGSFFSCTKSGHAIRLPPQIIRSIKINEKSHTPRLKILDMIRTGTQATETMMKQVEERGSADFHNILTQELNQVDKSFQSPRKRRPMIVTKPEVQKKSIAGTETRGQRPTIVKQKFLSAGTTSHFLRSSLDPRSSLNPSLNQTPRSSFKGSPRASFAKSKSPRPSLVPNAEPNCRKKPVMEYTTLYPWKLGQAKSNTTFKLRCEQNHLIHRLPKHSGRHLITVYWNNLDMCEEGGVVRGAGNPIIVDYSLSEAKSDFDLVNLQQVDSWPSFNKKQIPKQVSSIGPKLYKQKSEQKDLTTSQKSTVQAKTSGMFKTRSSFSLKAKKSDTSNTSRTSFAPRSLHNSRSSDMDQSKMPKKIEHGIRGNARYKNFALKLPEHSKEKDDTDCYMNKTPLTIAAERGHDECVQILLEMVVLKRYPHLNPTDPLTLATKARNPETIFLLLERMYSKDDFACAVLLAIREMYPVCLTALLSKGKGKNNLFDGKNLFHILYTQCVTTTHRYELMPEMTRALIACREDVNAHNVPKTFPMYTLINCAFNITVGKQIFYFIECLHILLQHNANPHFDEEKHSKNFAKTTQSIQRKSFTSSFNCIFDSAKNSLRYFEQSYWAKLFTKKFVTTIEMFDLTPRRILNSVLFEYMDAICELGLDRTIVKCLMRYGANPDFHSYGVEQRTMYNRFEQTTKVKYVVNVYFDNLLPYLTRFEVIDSYDRYRNELETLMVICRGMGYLHLSEALLIFLKDHLLSAPIQALPITRQFASMVDQLIRSPRPLFELAGKVIWLRVRRNKLKVMTLNLPTDVKNCIIP